MSAFARSGAASDGAHSAAERRAAQVGLPHHGQHWQRRRDLAPQVRACPHAAQVRPPGAEGKATAGAQQQPMCDNYFTHIFYCSVLSFAQELCREWNEKDPAQKQFEGFYRAVSAVAHSSGTKLKTRVQILNKVCCENLLCVFRCYLVANISLANHLKLNSN